MDIMIAVVPRRALVVALSLVAFGACSGEGSDIGPRLARLPTGSTKVQLLDDQNRGVVSGTVLVVGTQTRALTGRNGRGDFLATPRGRLLIRADGSAGAAVAGDRLAELQVAMDVTGNDLPAPIHLPDLPDSASATLQTGTQTTTTAITSVNGTTVTIPSGVNINSGPATPITIRVGELSPEHLPGDLPFAGSQTNLFGRGVFVHPANATFSPGIDIDVLDDLSLGAGTAVLYRLDPDTGEWGSVASATASAGRIALVGGITGGGLYTFGFGVSDRTVVGRVLDAAGNAVSGAVVRVDHRIATTGNDGRYSVDFVPAQLGDGSPRDAVVEVFAGGFWLPAVATSTVSLSANPADAGDLELDTVLAGNLRVQQVVRARSDAFQPARYSSLDTPVALLQTSDAAGQAIFEDVPAGFFGFQEARRRSAQQVYYGRALNVMSGGARWVDNYQFLFDRGWNQGTRSCQAYVCDSIGGGPIRDASLVEGFQASVGFLAKTRENGIVVGDRGFKGRATATLLSTRGGQSITHAFSIEQSSSDHVELPLRRVLRQPLGAFDRHGLVAGELTGASGSALHGIRVTRRFTKQEWWDDLVLGVPMPSSLPVDVDPATTHLEFQVGMDAVGGHLAAVEYTAPAGRNTLQKLGVLTDYVPVEGVVTALDVPLNLVADTTFSVIGAAGGVDPAVDLNNLTVALGLVSSTGQLVEVARDLSGSYAVAGSNLDFQLPALNGQLLGSEWLGLVSGSTVSGNFTLAHASLLTLAGPATSGFTFPEFPELTAPLPNAVVAASGFQMSFSLPAGAVGGIVELRSETSNELLLWQGVVRPERAGFGFVSLPVEADTPLLAGRTYTLSITAWFGTIDIAALDLFADFAAFTQTAGIIEVGVTQMSRRTITITT